MTDDMAQDSTIDTADIGKIQTSLDNLSKKVNIIEGRTLSTPVLLNIIQDNVKIMLKPYMTRDSINALIKDTIGTFHSDMSSGINKLQESVETVTTNLATFADRLNRHESRLDHSNEDIIALQQSQKELERGIMKQDVAFENITTLLTDINHVLQGNVGTGNVGIVARQTSLEHAVEKLLEITSVNQLHVQKQSELEKYRTQVQAEKEHKRRERNQRIKQGGWFVLKYGLTLAFGTGAGITTLTAVAQALLGVG